LLSYLLCNYITINSVVITVIAWMIQ